VIDDGLEQRLIDAFADARHTIEANPDLFARVARSLDDSVARRRWRLSVAGWLGAFVAANAALALALSYSNSSDINHGRFTVKWWVIELITNIVLVALAIGLGPFIKRFGRSYAADVFRANPRTGKSYLVLTDVAYYLIFTSFVMFTVTFVEPSDWAKSTGAQLKAELARVGGILLIMGVLHAANVVALPIIGRLLSSNKRLDDKPTQPARSGSPSVPPLGPGEWILRIEPAPGQRSAAAESPSDDAGI
jgi:hypothetical protein